MKCFSVVSGVRFRERSNIIYLQLQSAKLLPFGLIGSKFWIDLPSSESYVEFNKLATCYGSFNDPNVVLTGVRIFEQSVKYNYHSFLVMKKSVEVSVPMIELIGKRINYNQGTFENEVRFPLISRDSDVEEGSGDVVVQKNRIIPSAKKVHVSLIETSLSAPISAINIMSYVKESSRHYKPYIKCLKYQEILGI